MSSSIVEVERRLMHRIEEVERNMTLLKDQTQGLADATRHLTAAAREAISGAESIRTAHNAATTRAEFAEAAMHKVTKERDRLEDRLRQEEHDKKNLARTDRSTRRKTPGMIRSLHVLAFATVLTGIALPAFAQDPATQSTQKIIETGVLGALLVLSGLANILLLRHTAKMFETSEARQDRHATQMQETMKQHSQELMKVLLQQAEMSSRFSDVSERVISELDRLRG